MMRLSLLLFALLCLATPAHAQHSYLELSDYCKRGDWMDYTRMCKEFHLEEATIGTITPMVIGEHLMRLRNDEGAPVIIRGCANYSFGPGETLTLMWNAHCWERRPE